MEKAKKMEPPKEEDKMDENIKSEAKDEEPPKLDVDESTEKEQKETKKPIEPIAKVEKKKSVNEKKFDK